MRSRLLLMALVLCLGMAIWPYAMPPVRADCGLNNNSFEGQYTDRFGGGYGYVAPGWEVWYQDGPDQAVARNWRPSFAGFDAYYLGGARVRSGAYAQKFGTQWATHNAGLFQRVSVPRNSQVTFSVWALVFSSSGGDPTSVTGPGNYRVSVGIDPTGGTNWAASSVRWSEPRIEYLTWMQLSVSAQAESDTVTVFLRGDCEFPVNNNESTWDDACLSVVAPTPRPTSPPPPTKVPTITPVPTATTAPTPVTGSICAQAFADTNANGQRDDGEAGIGASFTLVDANRVEATGQASGAEPFCFGGLLEGSYTVKAALPAGYAATTPLEWTVELPAGGSPKVELGLKAQPTSTPPPTASPVPPTATQAPSTATPVPTPAPAGQTLGQAIYSVSGLLLILLAIALPVGWHYLRPKE